MKYYIKFGKTQTIIHHGNSIAACIFIFKRYFNTTPLPKTLPKYFRISQLGFDDHEDDEIYSTAGIIKTIQLSNKCRSNLEKKKNSK